jgi:hypothetical protein
MYVVLLFDRFDPMQSDFLPSSRNKGPTNIVIYRYHAINGVLMDICLAFHWVWPRYMQVNGPIEPAARS